MIDGIVYDYEIKLCIPSQEQDDDLEYCAGWDDFDNMGISVIGWASLRSTELGWITEPNLATFQEIVISTKANGGLIFGFNSKRFDDNLCAANNIQVKTDFDLLEEVRIAAYGSSRWQDCPKGFSYSLDAIANANGVRKTGSGSNAPRLYQNGMMQELISYCINDVNITRYLILEFLRGNLIDPNTGLTLKYSKEYSQVFGNES